MAVAGPQAVAEAVGRVGAPRAFEKARKEAADADQKSAQSQKTARECAQEAEKAADDVTSTRSKVTAIAAEVKELAEKLANAERAKKKAEGERDTAAREEARKKGAAERAEKNANAAEKEAQGKQDLLLCARAAAAEAQKAAVVRELLDKAAVVPRSGVQAVQPAAAFPVVSYVKMRDAVRNWLPNLSSPELQGMQQASLRLSISCCIPMPGNKAAKRDDIVSAIKSVKEARELSRLLDGAVKDGAVRDKSWPKLHRQISSETKTELVPRTLVPTLVRTLTLTLTLTLTMRGARRRRGRRAAAPAREQAGRRPPLTLLHCRLPPILL